MSISIPFIIIFFVIFLLLLLSLIYLIIISRKIEVKSPPNNDSLIENQAKTFQLKLIHKEKQLSRKTLMPLKIQAMERLILYLERIHPQSLVKRNLENAGSLRSFHLSLLQNIREEFEHNLAQQLYVSETTWQLICAAKEEMTKQINISVSNLSENSGAEQLAGALLTLDMAIIQKAIQELKAEFRNL
jgi:hypothetical protein